MLKVRCVLIGVALMILTGCASPVMDKHEIDKLSYRRGPELLIGNWQDLARYWDAHAEKVRPGFPQAARLEISAGDRTADIVVQNAEGAYVAMIKLTARDDHLTEMTSHATRELEKGLEPWETLIRRAQTAGLGR